MSAYPDTQQNPSDRQENQQQNGSSVISSGPSTVEIDNSPHQSVVNTNIDAESKSSNVILIKNLSDHQENQQQNGSSVISSGSSTIEIDDSPETSVVSTNVDAQSKSSHVILIKDDSSDSCLKRHERLTTLIIIGLIALLVGVDYAIILPTAWGYVNQFIAPNMVGIMVGILLAVFALAGSISGVFLGYLTDKGYKLKRLVLIMIIFKIVGNILYFVGTNISAIILGRLIAGIGMGLVPPLLAEISRRSTKETRTQLLAKILACRQIGLFLGPCFTIVLKQLNFMIGPLKITIYNAPGLLMAVLWILTGIAAFFLFLDLPQSETIDTSLEQTDNVTIKTTKCFFLVQMFRRSYIICKHPARFIVLIVTFVTYFNQTALETIITPFTNTQFNWSELEVSILFAVAAVEITLVYIALHFASKRFSDRSILVLGLILMAIGCIIAVCILPFAVPGDMRFLPAFLIFIIFDILALPLLAAINTSLFTKLVPTELQGVGQGVQRFIINLAAVAGPLVGGAVLQNVFALMCGMLGIVIVCTILIRCVIYRALKPV